MTFSLAVAEAAAAELEEQGRYYVERAGARVALQFAVEVEAIFRGLVEGRVVGSPHPHVRFRVPVRRVFMHRFPFAVVFYVDDKLVQVVALEALRRRPGYWRARLR